MVWIAAAFSAALWLLGLLATHPILFPPGVNFADILVYHGRFRLLHTAAFFTSRAYSGFAYPAGSAVIYALFYSTDSALNAYLALGGICAIVAAAALAWFLKQSQALALWLPLTIALIYPLVFCIQRANIEIVLWVLCAAAILLYRRGWAMGAAVLIGLAASAKLYPIFLLGFFLSRRRDVPAFFVGLLTFLAATAAAMAWTGPTFAIAASGFLHGVGHFQDHYVNTVSHIEIVYDHCLFAPVKNWAALHHTSTAPYIHTYYISAGVLALLLFLRVRTLPFLNRAVFLTLAMVCLPPVSFDYTLIHLAVPIVLMIGALVAGMREGRTAAWIVLALLLFVMTPIFALNVLGPLPTGLIQSITLLLAMLLTAPAAWPSDAVADR
jgi:hypothetical protein